MEEKIDELMKYMSDKEIANYNAYQRRLHEQASKQFHVISKAKENINSFNKLKINL